MTDHFIPTEDDNSSKPISRTPVRQAMDQYYIENYNVPMPSIKKATMNDGSKRLWMIIIITLLGAFIFSSYAYSFTDHVAGGLSMDLFSKDGEPSILAVAIHVVIFAIVIYATLYLFNRN